MQVFATQLTPTNTTYKGVSIGKDYGLPRAHKHVPLVAEYMIDKQQIHASQLLVKFSGRRWHLTTGGIIEPHDQDKLLLLSSEADIEHPLLLEVKSKLSGLLIIDKTKFQVGS